MRARRIARREESDTFLRLLAGIYEKLLLNRYGGIKLYSAALGPPARTGHRADDFDEEAALNNLDALVEGFLRVAVFHPDYALGNNRAGVNSPVDQVHGHARDLHTVFQCISHPVRAGESRQ